MSVKASWTTFFANPLSLIVSDRNDLQDHSPYGCQWQSAHRRRQLRLATELKSFPWGVYCGWLVWLGSSPHAKHVFEFKTKKKFPITWSWFCPLSNVWTPGTFLFFFLFQTKVEIKYNLKFRCFVQIRAKRNLETSFLMGFYPIVVILCQHLCVVK